MVEQKKLRCQECKEYIDVGSVIPRPEGPLDSDDTVKVLDFLFVHEGHSIETVGEYGDTYTDWVETHRTNGWEEANL